jgi:type VI protein secretion system component VasK
VPQRVESTDPDGVDFGWVMQTTFVLTVTVGAVVVTAVAVLTGVDLPTWEARASFAIRVGAIVWLVTATGVYAVARRRAAERGEAEQEGRTAQTSDEGGHSET